MNAIRTMAVALTVAGSDSGGGAGIQADLKTFHALGVFGTSAITALTAQNPSRVTAIQPAMPRIVTEQIERVFEAFDVAAAKTGMLYNAEIIRAVGAAFRKRRFASLVVDPVMVATSGAMLLEKNAMAALERELFPLALLLTPNRSEAERFSRQRITSVARARDAARMLAEKYRTNVLVKGGHLPGKHSVDVLCAEGELCEIDAPRATRVNAHGAGCAFSAAITANLALGHDLVESVSRAKKFITAALHDSSRIGKFHVLKI
jgi:hydroxymethylpyrimidine kinase/phosphomethylpyrimidine kinase